MLDFYYTATPQGQQLLMFLEETGLPFRRIAKAQALALVDHWPADGGDPLPLQQSGAMLLYLAEKAGFGMPAGMRGRTEARQWLFWQKQFECQGNATAQLFGTLERQLAERAYLAGEQYSVADMACYPWVSAGGETLAAYPNLARWFHAISQRPATRRAYGREMSIWGADPKVDISQLEEVLP
ncbi:MAG: thiol:disulfide oxidoreductase [Pseudoduganella sp.]|jgi:GST-like protein|nr:thiol:disulfide oxidoreductase [Pseudoduganella sp.]